MKTCVTTPALRCQRVTPFSVGACFSAALSSCPASQSEARHFGHAAEQALFRPGANQELIAARDDESRAPAAARRSSSAPCAESVS